MEKKSNRLSIVEELKKLNSACRLDRKLSRELKQKRVGLARRCLASQRATHQAFMAAWEVVGLPGQAKGSWGPIIASAYARLNKRDQRSLRSTALFSLSSYQCYESAMRLLPRRFSGPNSLLDLACAMEVLLGSHRLERAKELVPKLKRAVPQATNPFMRNSLNRLIPSYYDKAADWDRLVEFFEELRQDEAYPERALVGIVEAHLARAFLAAQSSLESLRTIKRAQPVEKGTDVAEVWDWSRTETRLLELHKMVKHALPTRWRMRIERKPSCPA